MKRRRLLQAIAAAVPLSAQQQPAPRPGSARPMGAPTPPPNLDTSVADEAAGTVTRFFTPPQFSALRKLSDTLMPPMSGAPGALDAQAPEFLDFLISQSPAPRQQLYRAGLDALNAAAHRRFGNAFAEVSAPQAAELLAPLRQPWTFDPPADPLAAFLRAAKADVRTATMNSQEYVKHSANSGRRGFGGQGLYWYTLD
ncbi:MAG: gluconate 2-dehydrogenase subunit 3 family protein [Acidobacteria bacterium]|nr:gluconate 2-dehydrogenase subunit 3 family protein [Acidobacteriota bacterium]